MSLNNALAEEIVALKSIYDNDLKHNGSEIIITLFPLQEKEKKEIYAQLDLCIFCSDSYPEKKPELSLKNVKGLSNNQIEILYSKLKDLALSLVGEVMIYNLAYCVQEYLSENNKPGRKSCYEEMIQRKELQKLEEYKSEIHKKTNLIKSIQEKQREMLQSVECDSSDYGEDEDEKSCVSYSSSDNDKILCDYSSKKHEKPCEHKNCKYLQFNNKILRGCCIEHDMKSIIYCAIDGITGDQLLLREWILKQRNKNIESIAIKQELEFIQNEVRNLKNICHENLISYFDFKWSFEKGDWFVYILQDFVMGCNLKMFIDKSAELDLNFIWYIISSILNALDHLHEHGIIHGSLNETCVYFTKSGVIKVGNYRIKKLMDDLHESLKYDELPQLHKQISQKSDILDIGLLILKVMKLSLIAQNSIMVPDFQPPELKDFVEKCLIENEENRWSTKKLLNHRFVKDREKKSPLIRRTLKDKRDFKMNDKKIEIPNNSFFEDSQSRSSWLAKEFKILDHLGSGSFGRVLKVKNKLDGRVYAIKAISLNTTNKQLGKKMIREVKLLSKLNHENVVRYYTSWIESDSDFRSNSYLDKESDVVDSKVSDNISRNNATFEYEDEIDYDDDDDDDDDDGDDEDDDYDDNDNDDDDDVEGEEKKEDEEEEHCGNEDNEEKEKDDVDGKNLKNRCMVEQKEQSSYIMFLRNSWDKNFKKGGGEKKLRELNNHIIEPNRTMYIQMEFCEKSTLRIAINEISCLKLCEDETRLWRLFREIVEGLAYVHGQGMIHRDLKPENIFLDSGDHVKIGDFGLAISVVSKSFLVPIGTSFGAGDNEASSQNIYDDFHTGRVGTSLYVAPELDKSCEKSYYNEKVDIYSLGIIFFEMCNGPFNTEMERIETLLNLRKFEIIFPSFWEETLFKQKSLAKLLLNHDPKSRPSCQEILEGNYLPPAEFEYELFQDVLRQTLTNPKSKSYKYLVSSCFDQEIPIEDDITYQWENFRSEKQHFIFDIVKERTEKILKKHGAIYLSVPLLLPQNKENGNVETRVQLMTHSGSIVNLPYDLRISFARYVAFKACTRLRRYVIEKVYREKKVHGLHPKEQFECSFDLVTPFSGIEKANLEVFSVVQEIINNFRSLKNRNCVIRLNHSFILKALLVHFNVEKWYSDIFKILSDAKESKYFKSKIESSLQVLRAQIGNTLINLLTKEDSYNSIKKYLFLLINKRGKALDMLNEAFKQIDVLMEKVEKLGIKLPVVIALGVVCNSEQCTDIMFDVVFEVKQKRKKKEKVTVMSGCRYDGLIASFRKFVDLTASNPLEYQSSGVGISIYLDKIATILKEDNILSEYVVICSFGNNIPSQSKQSMAKKLWESGINCYVEETVETVEELTDYCRENKILHIVNIKDESGFVYVMTWDSDKNHYLEKKISIRDLIEYIPKYSSNSESHLSPSLSRYPSDPQGKVVSSDVFNGNQNINIHIVSDDKLTTQRKRWESQLRSRILSVAGIFSSRVRLETVGVFLDEQKVKDLAVTFKASDSSDSFLAEIEWKPIKHYILKICVKLRSLFSENSNTVIILYSLLQDKYHIMQYS